MTAVADETSGTRSRMLARWAPATVAAMIYPLALRLFVEAIHAVRGAAGVDRGLWILGALAGLTLIIAPAALALRSLFLIRLDTSAQAIAARRLLHFAFAVPPAYLIWIRIAGGMNALIGNAASGLISWWALWIVLGVLVWNASRAAQAPGANTAGNAGTAGSGERTSSADRAPAALLDPPPASFLSTVVGRSRKVHRLAVVAILASFLVAHLANHLFALWSVPAQHTVMMALRTWYRAIWMEPLILALFVVAALTGLLRFGRLSRGQSDGFRVVQTASGVYLAFFLVSHIWATLGARYHGIDTNWAFASGGRAGMLASGVAAGVLVYYSFALLAVAAHAGLGLRMVLLSRRVRAAAANRSARLVFALGSAMSALIVAALLG
ncbi:MAG: hypothetical protein ACREUG_12105, partial [Steroidobacteraceae bacterium]